MMWNEDEFFKDYVKSVEDIKPDSDFVAGLKKNTTSQNVEKLKQKNRKRVVSCLAVAASLVLCFAIGGFGFGLFENNDKTMPSNPGSLSANREQNVGSQGSVCSQCPLADVVAMIKDMNYMVDNQMGESLSVEERENLAALLSQCEKTDRSVDTSLEEMIYYCVGDSTLKITIYGEKYVIVNDETYVIK